jgi:acetylornithine/succinyldiaminopimelate/putrescine aminotransferase
MAKRDFLGCWDLEDGEVEMLVRPEPPARADARLHLVDHEGRARALAERLHAPEELRGGVAAVIVEPVQGESGIWPVRDEVLLAARAACDRTGALLVFDEIQCGIGRTGTLWAFEQAPVRPDVFTAAKSLAGGLPIGACIAGAAAADAFERGDHGSTFGGGPVVAAAALATLDVIDDEQLLAGVRALGERLVAGLERLRGSGKLSAVRGRGLMVGADLPRPSAAEVVRAALEDHVVLNATGPATLRFLPPLVIDEADVDRVLDLLERLL